MSFAHLGIMLAVNNIPDLVSYLMFVAFFNYCDIAAKLKLGCRLILVLLNIYLLEERLGLFVALRNM